MTSKTMILVLSTGMLSLNCAKRDPAAESHNQPAAVASPAENAVSLPAASAALVGLKTEPANTQSVRCALRAMGKILACRPRTAIVTYAFPARVAAIQVAVGDWVEQGQPLITLESRDVGDALSEYYKALTALDLAKLNLDREARLLSDGVGVQKNHIAAEGEHRIAQASAEAGEKSLHVLGFSDAQIDEVRRTHRVNPTINLYAPIAGKVVSLSVVRGSIVDQATEILTIIDPAVVWADAEIYERDIARIKVGQDTEVTVPAYPGETFRGKTIYIADLVNEETRTITVRAELANGDRRLKPGMFADLTLIVDSAEQMVTVPSAAVLVKMGRQMVFVKENDRFIRREIETRSADGNVQPVIKGIAAGEEVVVQGNHELKSLFEQESLAAAHAH